MFAIRNALSAPGKMDLAEILDENGVECTERWQRSNGGNLGNIKLLKINLAAKIRNQYVM